MLVDMCPLKKVVVRVITLLSNSTTPSALTLQNMFVGPWFLHSHLVGTQNKNDLGLYHGSAVCFIPSFSHLLNL